MPDIASVLLITSVLFIIAVILLTIALMRMRGMTRRLQEALEDESGARDRAALLLAMASAVNSSLGLCDQPWRPCGRSSSGWRKTPHPASRREVTRSTCSWFPCSAQAS